MRGTTSPRLLLELMCAQILLPAREFRGEGTAGPAGTAGAAARRALSPAMSWPPRPRPRLSRQPRPPPSIRYRLARLPPGLRAGGRIRRRSCARASPAAADPAAAPAAAADTGCRPSPPRTGCAPARRGTGCAASPPRNRLRPSRPRNRLRPSRSRISTLLHRNHSGPGRPRGPVKPPSLTKPLSPRSPPSPGSPVGPPRPSRLRRRLRRPRPPPAARSPLRSFRQRWPEIVEAVKGQRRVAWMLLSNATVHSVEDGVLTVLFAREGEAKGFSASGYDRDLISALSSVLGTDPADQGAVRGPTGRTPGAPRSGHGGPDELSARAPSVVQPPEPPHATSPPRTLSAEAQLDSAPVQPPSTGPDRHGPDQARARRPHHRRNRRDLARCPRRCAGSIWMQSLGASGAGVATDSLPSASSAISGW